LRIEEKRDCFVPKGLAMTDDGTCAIDRNPPTG
jgi:hypothetical protein